MIHAKKREKGWREVIRYSLRKGLDDKETRKTGLRARREKSVFYQQEGLTQKAGDVDEQDGRRKVKKTKLRREQQGIEK